MPDERQETQPSGTCYFRLVFEPGSRLFTTHRGGGLPMEENPGRQSFVQQAVQYRMKNGGVVMLREMEQRQPINSPAHSLGRYLRRVKPYSVDQDDASTLTPENQDKLSQHNAQTSSCCSLLLFNRSLMRAGHVALRAAGHTFGYNNTQTGKRGYLGMRQHTPVDQAIGWNLRRKKTPEN